MAPRHVIVDGSNLATEGRSMPSLEQLDQAVREFIAENPTDDVTVVVDASFGHRIDPSEVAAFEAAEAAGEVVSPPAGAIGRGDAFLLRIAEKTGATVLSNDSFQEFHGEHTWLFDKGRLIGGKPVPGVGWIFMDRTPVRGAKSREVTKEAKRKKRVEADPAPKSAPAQEPKAKSRPKVVDRAIARATEEVTAPKEGSKRRRRGGSPPAEPVNEPLAFITFIAAHPLGSEVVGEVLEYSSHGAFVDADGARCYVPLSAMADPAPRRAREAVTRGERVTFIVQAFDPPRRGIELALPGFARVAGSPTAETVEAEIAGEAPAPTSPPRRSGRSGRSPAKAAEAPVPAGEAAAEPSVGSGRRSRSGARKAAADTATAPVSVAPEPEETATSTSATGPKKAPAKRTPAKKAAEKAPAKRVAARKTAAGSPPVEVVADGAATAKTDSGSAPAKKAPAAKKTAAVKKTTAAKKAPAKKAAAVPADATPADPAPAQSAPAKRAAPAKAKAAKKAAPVKKKATVAEAGSVADDNGTGSTPVPSRRRRSAAGRAAGSTESSAQTG